MVETPRQHPQTRESGRPVRRPGQDQDQGGQTEQVPADQPPDSQAPARETPNSQQDVGLPSSEEQH
jgi:hypothetical protein